MNRIIVLAPKVDKKEILMACCSGTKVRVAQG